MRCPSCRGDVLPSEKVLRILRRASEAALLLRGRIPSRKNHIEAAGIVFTQADVDKLIQDLQEITHQPTLW